MGTELTWEKSYLSGFVLGDLMLRMLLAVFTLTICASIFWNVYLGVKIPSAHVYASTPMQSSKNPP